MTNIVIEAVTTGPQLAAVRTLFEEYWASFGFPPTFQGFDSELACLPGAYTPPDGRLALTMVDGDVAPWLDIEGNPRTNDPNTPNTGVGAVHTLRRYGSLRVPAVAGAFCSADAPLGEEEAT